MLARSFVNQLTRKPAFTSGLDPKQSSGYSGAKHGGCLMSKRPQLELKRGNDQDGSALRTRQRGPTGPRTAIGKQRSKLNGVTYGILSRSFLAGSESKEEFESLLCGLRNCWQPMGEMEEVLVDLLATAFWRYQRLLQGNPLVPEQGSFQLSRSVQKASGVMTRGTHPIGATDSIISLRKSTGPVQRLRLREGLHEFAGFPVE